MSCSQWENFMSKGAIKRVDTVEDPILDVARTDGDSKDNWQSRYQLLDKADSGMSNFDFKKDKFRLGGE